MRRISLAVLVLALVGVPAGLAFSQAQDPLITSARQFSVQGNHDTAIAMLRGGLASRPGDEALKAALVNTLMLKRSELMRQASELSREIAALRPPTTGVAAVVIPGGQSPTTPIRVGAGIQTPMKVRDVKPVYPPAAQEAKVSGIVIAEITIGTDGTVTEAKILRGVPLLNEAALEAVKQWQYTPTLLNGVPVPVIMTATVTFSLQ